MPDIPPKPEPQSLLGKLSREHALRDAAWVAEFLNVAESWVDEATASGELPSIRVGTAVRFDPDVIKAWGRGKRANPSSSDRLVPFLEKISADVRALKGDQKPPALLMSFRQAAKLLKVDRITTLKVLVESGQLRTVMVNGKARIQRAEVERLAAEGFDRDAPSKRKSDPGPKMRPDRTPKPSPGDVESAIMRMKF